MEPLAPRAGRDGCRGPERRAGRVPDRCLGRYPAWIR